MIRFTNVPEIKNNRVVMSRTNSQISELVVPEGVTHIDANALANNKFLRRVVLPSTLIEVGEGAFRNCPKLVELCNNSVISLTELDISLYMTPNARSWEQKLLRVTTKISLSPTG